MPRDKEYMAHLNFDVKPEVKNDFCRACSQAGRTTGSVLRDLMKLYIKRQVILPQEVDTYFTEDEIKKLKALAGGSSEDI